MSRHLGQAPVSNSIIQQVPIGGIAAVLRSGDAYKAVGEVVSRTAYPALSAAFPRNGSFNSFGPTTIGPVNSIAYGAGLFVAVGGNATPSGVSYYSADGKDWYAANMPSSTAWSSVAYDGALGLFVALSSSGLLASSPDGVTWKSLTALNNGVSWVKIAASGTGKFVAIAGPSTNTAASSADGVTFTVRTLPSSDSWLGLNYGAGVFVACSTSTSAATSPDGVTWTARTLPAAGCQDVGFGAGLFVAVGVGGAGGFATSPDGITWTARTSGSAPAGGAYRNTIAYGNGVFVASRGTGSLVAISNDGITWRSKYQASGAFVGAVAYGAGVFVASDVTGGTNKGGTIYAEDTTTSDYLYLSGTPGQFVRVK